MKWYVIDMDEGLLKVERLRRDAVAWLMDHHLADRVVERHQYAEGNYEYKVGSGDPYDSDSAFILREDKLERYFGHKPTEEDLTPRYRRGHVEDEA